MVGSRSNSVDGFMDLLVATMASHRFRSVGPSTLLGRWAREQARTRAPKLTFTFADPNNRTSYTRAAFVVSPGRARS